MRDYYFISGRRHKLSNTGGGGGGGSSHTGEKGRLSIRDLAILREDGSTFPFRGADSFSLFHRFLIGENILPVLLELVSLGCNVIRVFAMYNEHGIGKVNGLGRLRPNDHPNYYAAWHPFLELCATVGMRVEVPLLADAQEMSIGEQQEHVNLLYNILEGHWNANFCETCNEPKINGVDLDQVAPRKGLVLRASGNYDLEHGKIGYVLDYVTLHTERKFEWPRTCRTLGEFRDGADGLEAVRVPVVSDEPTGVAEAARPDARTGPDYFPPDHHEGWTWLDDLRQYAAGCQMFGAGSTFHYDDGVTSRLMGPNQKIAAIEWFKAVIWMPVEAQFSQYQRGGEGGGAGVGDMPINHHDLHEPYPVRSLRTYAKRGQGLEFCVAIRKGKEWFTEPLRGCTVVEQTFPGLTKVREP